MHILALTRYSRLGASSRMRTLQYLPYLESQGERITIQTLFSDRYLTRLYKGRSVLFAALAGYLRRVNCLWCVRQYDLVWIEKELFPFCPAIAERVLSWLGVPFVVDYDDALFHRYDRNRNPLIRAFLGRKIDTVMRFATLVIVGNEYLADRARNVGAVRVEVVPTVVDLERYPIAHKHLGDKPLIGWIGSPSTAQYLKLVEHALAWAQAEYGVRVRLIGSGPISFRNVDAEVIEWREEEEAEQISAFDIGIMPLSDGPWERGKCGYKLIQYMACGVPVIASPVGVNKIIVTNGDNGLLAENAQAWVETLASLLEDPLLRRRLGQVGRERVEDEYCLAVVAPRIHGLLWSLAES